MYILELKRLYRNLHHILFYFCNIRCTLTHFFFTKIIETAIPAAYCEMHKLKYYWRWTWISRKSLMCKIFNILQISDLVKIRTCSVLKHFGFLRNLRICIAESYIVEKKKSFQKLLMLIISVFCRLEMY